MNALRRARVLSELSQEELAQLSGVSRSAIQAAENVGIKSIATAKKLGVALKADWRLFVDDDAHNSEHGASHTA